MERAPRFGGFVPGIALSEVISAVGLVLLDESVGIGFLPVILALARALAAPVVDRRVRHGSR